MTNNPLIIKNKAGFLLLWTAVNALGWLLAPINTFKPLMTYLEVANRMLVYAGCGLLMGLVIGTGQSFILMKQTGVSKKWFFITLAGYSLAWPVGLAISTLIPSIAFHLQASGFLPISQPGTVWYYSFPLDLFFGAWLIGLAQWMILRILLPYRNSRLAALWILGGGLSVGLGIIAMFIGRTVPLDFHAGMLFDVTLAFDRVKIGLTSGLVTGLLLWFVIDQAGRAKTVTKSMVQLN
jgi:hypothetical protein